MYFKDTIAAISTAIGEGGIGIVRVSGPEAISTINKIFKGYGQTDKDLNEVDTYTAHYGHIINPKDEQIIDEVICLVMKATKTYTKEDVVEIDCHGGSIPLQKILDLVLKNGARLAEPGEFTKRAFLNGRIDLSQAEAVMDVINSKTEAGLEAAMDQLEGGLSSQIEEIKHKLLGLLAHLEASIDFPEDEIEDFNSDEIDSRVEEIIEQIEGLLATSKRGRIIKEGIRTAIIGKPNVGKSSLLNALLRENRAIVTDVPGTTRDVIEEVINIDGIPLKIMDTAGIRETEDEVEKIGVERSEKFLKQADLVLLVLDAHRGITEEDRRIINLVDEKETVVVVNKTDLESNLNLGELKKKFENVQVVETSAVEGIGISELEDLISEMVFAGEVKANEQTLITNLRHKEALEAAYDSILNVKETVKQGLPADFVTIDLKTTLEELGKITGDTLGEDIIDRIFADFCLGK
ncbi:MULTISPECIES: tRNA uridine-5-carboxymethylaminomethyl(34) synthesis GTPase MnmE [unclassified Candidatus Frackibacter]|uniref:tRNA uridine-5-carboxymethylaminomethyl(34) synthesis GTPase MnmE n=1 Tax=unclassified Candidatus Frackibacter TaxID=2648818 RepID=UPI000884E26B|nr:MULTISPECIES: tRNA uridine-5-carboxymethylaminomethyl(34) synthesis GTPase MnmE [unclassified Candidatus Frackibacter]SDC43751.1 tRNA modification GTPase trmE [Candidatus Frackibacter sp. WG11]SEM64144.1 tRNA modification GTPase trmE [Candidatus Frackibacter sp. WG12]SFL68658.1 tRNA modification GTPase trmE [Candidatus Frackibacter sp. WG13]